MGCSYTPLELPRDHCCFYLLARQRLQRTDIFLRPRPQFRNLLRHRSFLSTITADYQPLSLNDKEPTPSPAFASLSLPYTLSRAEGLTCGHVDTPRRFRRSSSICSYIAHNSPCGHALQSLAGNSGCAPRISRQASRSVRKGLNKYGLQRTTALLHERPNRLRAASHRLQVTDHCQKLFALIQIKNVARLAQAIVTAARRTVTYRRVDRRYS